MKHITAIFALFFATVFAENDSSFTFNAVTFSEHYPRFEAEDYESPPEWSDTECVLTYGSLSDYIEICEERFTFDGGEAYYSRVDSSVAITHTFAKAQGGDSLYPSWQFWRVGNGKKLPMTSVIIDEFKMYHECGFLNMPWAEADSIIRRIVFDVMLSGDTSADWADRDCFNASGLESLYRLGSQSSIVVPGEEKKIRLTFIGPYPSFPPQSVSGLMQTTAIRPTKLPPSFRMTKLSPNRFVVEGLPFGEPYRLFDLKGNLLQKSDWNGGEIVVNRLPAILQIRGKAYLLR